MMKLTTLVAMATLFTSAPAGAALRIELTASVLGAMPESDPANPGDGAFYETYASVHQGISGIPLLIELDLTAIGTGSVRLDEVTRAIGSRVSGGTSKVVPELVRLAAWTGLDGGRLGTKAPTVVRAGETIRTFWTLSLPEGLPPEPGRYDVALFSLVSTRRGHPELSFAADFRIEVRSARDTEAERAAETAVEAGLRVGTALSSVAPVAAREVLDNAWSRVQRLLDAHPLYEAPWNLTSRYQAARLALQRGDSQAAISHLTAVLQCADKPCTLRHFGLDGGLLPGPIADHLNQRLITLLGGPVRLLSR